MRRFLRQLMVELGILLGLRTCRCTPAGADTWPTPIQCQLHVARLEATTATTTGRLQLIARYALDLERDKALLEVELA